MGTAYSTIFDKFMVRIKDWRLDNLFQASVPDFENYLIGFLDGAVDLFQSCNQTLTRDDTTKLFDNDLTDINIMMLSRLMVEVWLEKEVQDVRQMSLNITDKDFKHYSEAQNLAAKNARWSEVRERNSQALLEYGYRNINMTNWLIQDFYTES